MCLGLGLLERVTGARGARKAAQRNAKRQEEQALLQTQGTQNQFETNLAQQRQATKVAELLGVPVEGTDVAIGDGAGDELDPTTGRRRTVRSRFQMPATSGLVIP